MKAAEEIVAYQEETGETWERLARQLDVSALRLEGKSDPRASHPPHA